jgi:hypothetical protein
MIAHTLHVKQLAMFTDILDRIANNKDISNEFAHRVAKAIEDARDAVLQVDKQLMTEYGEMVRVSGTNIVFSTT